MTQQREWRVQWPGESNYEMVGSDPPVVELCLGQGGQVIRNNQSVLGTCSYSVGRLRNPWRRIPGNTVSHPPAATGVACLDCCYGVIKRKVTLEIWRMEAFGLLVGTLRSSVHLPVLILGNAQSFSPEHLGLALKS